MRLFRCLALLLPLASAAVPLSANAEDGQRVILVLDASGSMWGQIDGKPKMEIAKEVVGKVVSTWKAGDELGLVAYGHRVKGSCDDIEVVSEPAVLDASSFMAKVKGLNPKGKTPMTQAVRQAAEALKYTERKATVILVSDGIETCDPDPCAVAEELEKLGVGLTVHTVGFGLDDKRAVDQLKCLADRTGGISVLADNANELEDALTKTVEAESPPASPPPEPKSEFNVTGEAVLAEGVPLPEGFDGVAWDFFTAVNGEKGQSARTEYGASMKGNIEAPGDYVVHVTNRQAALDVPVTITADGTARLDVSFEAGIVTLTAMMDEKTRAPDDGVTWELLSTSGEVMATEYGQDKSFLAAAGPYKVRLSLGSARVEQDVAIAAGKTETVTMALGAGVAEATAVFAPGGPKVPDGAAFEFYKAEQALDGSREHVWTDYRAVSSTKVPAGKYVVVVQLDYAKGEGTLDVPAGGAGKVEVNLDAGYLAIDGPPGGLLEVFGADKDISGQRPYLGAEYDGDINKAFEAGRYHVTMKVNGELVGEKDFEVKAGQRTEGTFP